MNPETPFIVSAWKRPQNNFYSNIGRQIELAESSVCGEKKENRYSVTFTVSQDQTTRTGYWGWWDNEERKWLFIYPARNMVVMCFPYPIDAYEKKGIGRLYRLDIVNEEKICLFK
jgi:hypothetical protein